MRARANLASPAPIAGFDGEGAGTRVLEPQLREIYLHPGQMYASKQPARISMILGSCVSVCLFDHRQMIGGATHYMLAKWDRTGQPSARYGDVAIDSLISQLQLLGSRAKDLRGMIFGGARMFQALGAENGGHIGTRNVEIAAAILSQHAISVVKKNIGGCNGRKLRMQTDTGMVSLSLIGNE